MRLPPVNGWAMAIVAAAVTVLLGWQSCAARDAGAREALALERARVAEREANRLRDVQPRLDTVYRESVKALGVSTARYQSVRDSLRRALAAIGANSANSSSNPPINSANPPAPLDTALVSRALAAGDSALKDCSLVVLACGAQRDSARAEVQALRTALAARKELRDVERCRILRIAPCPSRGLVFGAGVVLGAAGVGAVRR